MSNSIEQVQSDLQQWRDSAIENGWLTKGVGVELDSQLAGDPAHLFSGVTQRPLIVAFFGGTGVGKSSLLNRLAGAEVARTGVVRPTSREVTIHAHESLSLSQLPEQIPADKVRLSTHSDAASSHIVWIDTPDVDSVATEHRDQVLSWLPYVDLVVYVVSPERYRDDAGWQMLREAGDQHAWMFALNQWDRGQPEQLADFKKVLITAGFGDPQVFCTICKEGAEGAEDDDFEQLRAAVEQLGEKNNVQLLVAQAEAAQTERLRASVEGCIDSLGDELALSKVNSDFAEGFEQKSEKIIEDLSWQINALARQYQNEQGGWRQLFSAKQSVTSLAAADTSSLVWDARAEQQVQDALSGLVVSAGQEHMSLGPMRQILRPLAERVSEIVSKHQRHSLNEAFARPGTRLHRWLFNAVAFIAAVAPIAALVWIAYRVVISFHAGNEASGEYLGGNFAINSVLLLGVAWLLPALLREKVRPSLSAAVARALRQGLGSALAEVAAEAKSCTLAFNEQRESVREAARTIVAKLPVTSKALYKELAALRPQGNAAD